ncbi:uncharacterized protein FIBRA_05808 [Fibroporia radiculosa]|uniref:Uncharacterized protein n=1 Tax=Fibroporia radiculosa TaxID=599839 RepID=J4H3Q7_9APHY|nr:uncharacterized protein FIBRA_05808 [Fibroporia radiculosa]CCM03664.1 predicted protein [Fibroporia radiculosa]
MNEDVDMDAPQISTLREEETPEPQPARTSKFRVKLLVNEGKRSGSSTRKEVRGRSEDEEDEEDEEEDQLIDDDDDDDVSQPIPTPVIPIVPSLTSRGSPSKRGGRGRGGRRKVAGRAELTTPATTLSPHGEILDVSIAGSSTPLVTQTITKKRGGAGKAVTAQRAIKRKPSKTAKTGIIVQRDDAESVISEGTAASSPMPHEERTPEPDIPIPSMAPVVPAEEGGLDGVPLPVYPLPSKPFPVQPPPKIGTGFAPVMPLDKSGKPVRRWRQVNREVRGIAGGRWFTRTWAGEKESEFASAQVAASQALVQAAQLATEREHASAAALAAAGITYPPKLAALSAAPSGRGAKTKVTKIDGTPSSTVPASRADSAVPESASAHSVKRRGSALVAAEASVVSTSAV